MFRLLGSLGATLVAISFLGLGAGSLAAPHALAENYGLPVEDETGIAYVRAVGMRDAVLGLVLLAFLVRREREPLAIVVGLSALVGASDFTIVGTRRGAAAPRSLTIHGTGTIGLIGIWALLRAQR